MSRMISAPSLRVAKFQPIAVFRISAISGALVGEQHAAQLEVPERDAAGDDERLVGDDLVRREAHHQVAAVVRGALHRLLHHRFADVVEHDVDASVAGLREHDLGEVGVVVVDRDVGAEVAAQLHLLVGARGREHARADVLRRAGPRPSPSRRRRRG